MPARMQAQQILSDSSIYGQAWEFEREGCFTYFAQELLLLKARGNSQNDKGEVFIPCNFAAGGTHSEKCIRISTSAAIAKPVSEIGEFIEDVRWNVTFKNPNVQRALRRLAAEALEEYEAGEAEEGGFAIE